MDKCSSTSHQLKDYISLIAGFKRYLKNGEFRVTFKPNPRGVTDEIIQMLAQEPHWKDLRHLDLSGARKLTDKGVKFLPPHLLTLNLSDTGITNDGIEGLSTYLKELHLNNTPITSLSKSFSIRQANLRTLSLAGTRIYKMALLTFLPKNINNLYLTNTPAMPISFIGALPRTFHHLMDHTYLQSLEKSKGFSWRIDKEGHPPHFLVGLCHWCSRHMNQNPSLLAALAQSKIVFTEQGFKSGSFLWGWEASADGFIRETACKDNLDLRALDSNESEKGVSQLQRIERQAQEKQIFLFEALTKLVGPILGKEIIRGSMDGNDQGASRLEERINRNLTRMEQEYVRKQLIRTWIDIDNDAQIASRLEETLHPTSANQKYLWNEIVRAWIDRDDRNVARSKETLHPTSANQEDLWNEIVRAWIEGDDQSALRLEQMLNPTYLGRFRTSQWMKQLVPLLDASKETVGIFPGYLHAVGPEGMVELLKKQGWNLTRLPMPSLGPK